MGKLVLIIAMLAAGVAGYFIGGWSGRSAKEALAKAETSAKESEAQFQKTKQELEQKLASIGSQHEAEKQKINDDFKKQQDEFTSAVATRDQRIVTMQKERTGIQSQIVAAQARASAAKTDADRKAAEADVLRLQKQEQVVVVTVQGEQCAVVKVPPSLLAALRGTTP